MLISSNGVLIRTPVDGISIVGRNTQGVTLIKLVDEQKLVGLAKIISIAILILPMFFLWKSVNENRAFRYWEPRQFYIVNPDFTRELVF